MIRELKIYIGIKNSYVKLPRAQIELINPIFLAHMFNTKYNFVSRIKDVPLSMRLHMLRIVFVNRV